MRKSLALVLFGSTVAFVGAYVALAGQSRELANTGTWTADIGPIAFMVGFGGVGFVLALHRPRHPIGWLLLGTGLVLAARSALEELALLAADRGSLLQAQWAVLGINILGEVGLALLVTVVVLFPGGEVAGRWWRLALILVWATSAIALLAAPFAVYTNGDVDVPALATISGADNLAFFLAVPRFAVLFAAMGRVVMLAFRGDETERHQIRWVAYVLVVTLALLAVASLFPPAGDVAGIIAGIGVPVAIGIAITRYRLYDIDRIVNRTVVYGIVITVLAFVFVSLVALPTLLLGSGDAPAWVVAASTLAVFVLFNPVRLRVQRLVDRRFHRLPYDPERVLSELGHRLRGEVAVASVTESLTQVATDTLQPMSVSVWTRPTRSDSGTVPR